MLPPQVNTSQRAALQGVVSGAVIYNTTTNRVEIYLPSDGNQRTTYWCGISTVG